MAAGSGVAAPARDVLRVATAGSVDDGKSTLIGRLLHDAKSIFEDQLRAVERATRRYGNGSGAGSGGAGVNLALLTDGLRAEREQGITIDVAHRYFATPARSFIIADTPGHAQYTRNMVTGASTADVAIVLVDAQRGASEQTRRHAFIAALLGVDAIVLAVNKMDLTGWDPQAYDAVVTEVGAYVDALPTPVPVIAVPLSALHGDNVVERSPHSPWYGGPSLLELLESFEPSAHADVGARLDVQWVVRHAGGRDYTGVITGGDLTVGDEVVALPSGARSTVTGLRRSGREVERIEAGHAAGVALADELDISRGDVLVAGGATQPPVVTDTVEGHVCWMVDAPLRPGTRWWFKHGTRTGRATVDAVLERRDIVTLEPLAADELGLNDLGRVRLSLAPAVVALPYDVHPEAGRLILVDEATNTTAGAVMLRVLQS